MIKKIVIISLLLSSALVDAQDSLVSSIETRGMLSSGDTKPFWFYANQNGRVDSKSNFMTLAAVKYANSFNESNALEVGGGLLYNDGLYEDIKIDELYAKYTWKIVEASAGIKHRDEKLKGISSVGGDIIWSNNARALPGLYIEMTEPIKIFKWLQAKGTFGHYYLGDDRVVKNAQVHHKSLELALVFSPGDRLSGSMKHYVQFGGTSPRYGKQPSSFRNYIDVFFGQGSSTNDAFEGDQINSLGNGLGSYELAYDLTRENYYLRLYHQSLFEDTSGIELSNFPDGVWGAYLEPANSKYIDAIVYEYVQTVSQSGRFMLNGDIGRFSGGDSYFWNGIYNTGWQYENQIIGLPFILPGEFGRRFKNDRSFVHHLGITGALGEFKYKAKGTYVKNLGTYNDPYPKSEQAVYSFLEIEYPTQYGNFTGLFAIDYSNLTKENLGLGLKYYYSF
ncbi:capsule assembly Wzi family protein [Leeuwenhoekiella aequorea]|uniref:Capsule assembly protein Wzi n=1 Tax=Leeuwenhoekiella aequorea TaxID=283736 RepID=A0A4Q0P3E8_9FLAO|nr:capsule assembly Wzi family protein [Leeuwenhoekiella aequorea]RXG21090.1 capsule assembly protein Wzi [Leeuwenhoekiella aequorea]